MILHLVTDRRRLAPGCSVPQALACLQRQAQQAIDAGVDVVQIRERDLESRTLFTLVEAIVRLARGTATRVLVNDRLDVALAAEANGVHLPARSLPVAAARSIGPPGFIVGRSVHNAEEFEAARGADYVCVGTVWRSPSKPDDHDCLGVEGLRRLIQHASMPVVAIGGIGLAQFADVAWSGAAGVAAIGLFTGPPDAEGCGAVDLASVVRAARKFDSTGTRS